MLRNSRPAGPKSKRILPLDATGPALCGVFSCDLQRGQGGVVVRLLSDLGHEFAVLDVAVAIDDDDGTSSKALELIAFNSVGGKETHKLMAVSRILQILLQFQLESHAKPPSSQRASIESLRAWRLCVRFFQRLEAVVTRM